MQKKFLQETFKIDFELLAIASPLADYQLAWHTNNLLNLSLKRVEDHHISLKKDVFLSTSCFAYKTEHSTFKLFKNKLNEGAGAILLIPEMKNIDYFLLIQDDTEEVEILNVKNTLSKIKNVILIQIIDANRLKSVVNLMT